MNILIRNGRVIDPSQELDGICDVLIENGKIREFQKKARNKGQDAEKNSKFKIQNSKLEIFDAAGMLVFPGLVDMHVHLREPGFEYKETIKTGTEAASEEGSPRYAACRIRTP